MLRRTLEIYKRNIFDVYPGLITKCRRSAVPPPDSQTYLFPRQSPIAI